MVRAWSACGGARLDESLRAPPEAKGLSRVTLPVYISARTHPQDHRSTLAE